MWPVPIHGSLVIMTSPGLSVFGGNLARKCLTVAGSVPMNDGIDSTDCAIERPCASVSTTAKSLASRTSSENGVRTNPADASSTMLTSPDLVLLWLMDTRFADRPETVFLPPRPCNREEFL